MNYRNQQQKDKMLYYKYMSYARFKESVLPGGAFIKVSRPWEFNDPFDCVGELAGDLRRNVAEAYCNSILEVIPDFCEIYAKAHFLGCMQSRHFFDEWIRVLSLSDASRISPEGEALMFAHYADNSKGVRLTIDFSNYPKKVENVKYEDSAPVLDCGDVLEFNPIKDETLRHFLEDCLLTKYKCWQYECEGRVIFPVEWKDLKPMTAGDSVKPFCERNLVWAMPKEMLIEVSLGPAFPNLAEAQKYVEDLKGNGYENIKARPMRVGNWY